MEERIISENSNNQIAFSGLSGVLYFVDAQNAEFTIDFMQKFNTILKKLREIIIILTIIGKANLYHNSI